MRETRATSARVGAAWRTAGAVALLPPGVAAEGTGDRNPYFNPAPRFGPEAAPGCSLTPVAGLRLHAHL